MLTSCAYRSMTGSFCASGPLTLTSYAILAKPKWSVHCPDGREVKFESDTEIEDALKAVVKDH